VQRAIRTVGNRLKRRRGRRAPFRQASTTVLPERMAWITSASHHGRAAGRGWRARSSEESHRRSVVAAPLAIPSCLVYTKQVHKRSKSISDCNSAYKRAVIYARVSSKEQEKEGFSIPAQLKLLKEYAAAQGFAIVQEYVDVETAKQTGRSAFGEMVAYLKAHLAVRVLLVEKTDRLYRNLKDWVTVDDWMSRSTSPRKAWCCPGSRDPQKNLCTASRC
jgi:Resolvase, N terminal domain